ncbi:MAG: M23 family metallopeptidase [Clostridia bacterium]
MEKRFTFKTLGFILFSIISLVLVFSAVVVTVMNVYKPAVKTYLNGKFIGYFSNEQQFDQVYNELVSEKQNIDPNVKVYLDCEPIFQSCYIKDKLLAQQNIYTNLRAEIKTEYTIYNVALNGENKMTFTNQDDANKYAQTFKKEVSKLNTEIQIKKVKTLGETTTIDRAEAIMKDIVARNKPIEIPKVVSKVRVVSKKSTNTTYNGQVDASIANNANVQGGIWPTTARNITSTFGYRGDFHTGIDLAGPSGSSIFAYKDGVVTFSGYSSDYGNYIKIDHGNGFSTLYAHSSKLLVRAGNVVKQGQTIALIGRTGWATGNHLHFEVRINGKCTNPYPYIAGK